MTRLTLIETILKTKTGYIECKCCGFKYLPMTNLREDECPKCDSIPWLSLDEQGLGDNQEDDNEELIDLKWHE